MGRRYEKYPVGEGLGGPLPRAGLGQRGPGSILVLPVWAGSLPSSQVAHSGGPHLVRFPRSRWSTLRITESLPLPAAPSLPVLLSVVVRVFQMPGSRRPLSLTLITAMHGRLSHPACTIAPSLCELASPSPSSGGPTLSLGPALR